MKIVIEYVLAENFLINFIILKTTALLTKEKCKLKFLSAFLCACLTVVMPLFALSSFGWFLVEIGQVILAICVSFKFKKVKKFAQIFLCYFAATFLYGGACYFLEGLFGQRTFLVLLAFIVAIYFVIKFLFKHFQRKKAVGQFCFDVELEASGRKGKWKAFLDSGNMLFDPLTDAPVTLINFKVFSALFSEIKLEDLLRKNVKGLRFAHYINFNTLGSDNKILVFQADRLFFEGQIFEKPTLGLCLKNFNEAFGSDIILNNTVVTCK